MKTQEFRCSFKRPQVEVDSYGDPIETLINLEPIYIWLTTKDVVKFNQVDLEGLKYEYIGITKDQRPQKNDLIDNKKVVYKTIVNRFIYLFLDDVEGRDDVDD